MSGGVDSSVAAALLQEQGYEVVGCFMRLGSMDGPGDEPAGSEAPAGQAADDPFACNIEKARAGKQGCCSLNDAADARLVAAMLDIPFYVMNFRDAFDRIIDYFVDEYNAGRTPNPCIRCNTWLKFGRLAAYARSIDADYVATGHYARVHHDADPPRLLRGLDAAKDQSYVLFGTELDALRHMLLPIGEYEKSTVRQIAAAKKLPVFDKPDSQEICFVPDDNYAGLLQRRTPEKLVPGPIVDRAGNRVGDHPGHQHFTIGQRRGLSVSLGHPVYVVDKDPATNTVTVGPVDDIFSSALEADGVNWLIDPPRCEALRCEVKIRYNAQPVPATVRATRQASLRVVFDQPQRAVSPGQAVVCYDGPRVLGGGWISRAH